MAGAVSGLSTFQTQVGPIPLSQLDSNFTLLTAAVNSLANFSNSYMDSGVHDALVVTVNNPQTVSYSDGLMLLVKVAATNTTATPTINVNSLGAKTIVNAGGGVIFPGQLLTNNYVLLVYNNNISSFVLLAGGAPPQVNLFKASDTSRFSNTTPVADLDLIYNIPVAGTYRVEVFMQWFTTGATGNNPGLITALGFTGTLGGTGTYFGTALGNMNGAVGNVTGGMNSNTPWPLLSAFNNTLQFVYTFVATSAGTVSLNWSQQTSNATATTLRAGSYMTVTAL